jgi:integrase
MSIRKREWTTRSGKERTAWLVDYFDAGGTRRQKQFKRKDDATDWDANTKVAVREGTHVPDSASVTVADAGKLWIKSAKAAGLERTTIEQYETHLRLHIVGDGVPPEEQERDLYIGHFKLSQLNAPTVRAFEDRLQERGRSPVMVRYIVRSLGALLADAQERGLIVRNPVRELRGRRRRGSAPQERRGGKLKIGVDIPTPEEIKLIVNTVEGRWRPLLLTAIFTGLRASELRGLAWSNVDLKRGMLHVRQRADKHKKIGAPKSEAGERTVPLSPILVSTLREWKVKCPNTDLDLVFPTDVLNREGRPGGRVQDHVNIVERGVKPAMLAAGVTVPVLNENGKPKRDENGKPMVEAKYGGLHAFRHFYASWCINRKEDGGLGLTPKMVQERMGHSSIQVTMDRYGHLFKSENDGRELAEAERVLLG